MTFRNHLLGTAAAAAATASGDGRRGGAPGPAPATDGSAGAPGERFHSRRSAAEFLRLSERTLERYAVEGGGPPFATVGRRVIYAESDLVAWMRARMVASTSDAAARRAREDAA